LFRYADDFVACFDYRHEAAEFEKALGERLKKFGLELAADKTKTLRFGRGGGRGNGRFDFLGFRVPMGKGKEGLASDQATHFNKEAQVRGGPDERVD
jgi:RNA-directed DNA polymerase